jgi:hypothetical protein
MDNSQGIVDLVPEPEIYCKIRKYRHKRRELNSQLGLESVQDIRSLFVDNSSFLTQSQRDSPRLIDLYKPFDFTNIVGQPHDLPTSLEKMHVFMVTKVLVLMNIGMILWIML